LLLEKIKMTFSYLNLKKLLKELWQVYKKEICFLMKKKNVWHITNVVELSPLGLLKVQIQSSKYRLLLTLRVIKDIHMSSKMRCH